MSIFLLPDSKFSRVEISLYASRMHSSTGYFKYIIHIILTALMSVIIVLIYIDEGSGVKQVKLPCSSEKINFYIGLSII